MLFKVQLGEVAEMCCDCGCDSSPMKWRETGNFQIFALTWFLSGSFMLDDVGMNGECTVISYVYKIYLTL